MVVGRLLPVLTLAARATALNIGVLGSTGRTGQLVVQRLLEDGHRVKAFTRDEAKAKAVLPPSVDLLSTATLDIASAPVEAMRDACTDMDRLIWCASGFTDGGESIDVLGMRTITAAFKDGGDADGCPRVVMLSSAGVTRPAWADDKKQRLLGASDIPIIRLNPGNILDRKAEAEALLRASDVPYCVVRPTGLKFEGWPQGRPLFSQGDVAVGRTNALDLADVLVAVCTEPAACGKTFEMFTLAGYPAPRSMDGLLRRLASDMDGPPTEAAVSATYDVLQQLLPGEEQDATKLEMGRSYEQLDSGEVAPRAQGASPTDREVALASTVAGGDGGGSKRQRIRAALGRLLKI